MLSQGITAGTSLLLQMVAARVLGLAEFGAFAVFLALLVSASALYTGWVGDSLAVLDRHDPDTRAALVSSAVGGWALLFAAGCGAGLVVGDGGTVTALAYAAMLVCWLAEETIRRLLMARLRFWHLVVNDACYLAGTVAVLALVAAMGEITLASLFGAMCAGACVAVVAGVGQLPREELRQLRPGLAGMRAVASFAVWRSLQATLRPAAMLGSRVLVSGVVSLAAVGLLEAGRLVVAPLQVVINGAGSFLLAGFAARERGGGGTRLSADRAALLLAAATAVGGTLPAVFARPLGELLIGQPVEPLLVLGWVAYLTVWAAGLPYVTEAVARRMSRRVFTIRLADSAAGLATAAAVLVLGGGIAAVPWAMACGGVLSAWRLRRSAARGGPDRRNR
ncbi:hypothetical protein [Saccharopolyspora erythraea]|uniref:O-antigen/teichoic acid export membrane protein n=1 Tax=Saccharopolyspora erythraea (strain ATCC 11635 / DSM 40517 / JCM 4748 / NBRC 13426 / NCIMB 8594 / NRRL 2338) TaxID=405948 RepID=A4FEI7_SACEN|nr:hypothetical protein [Saccharopolyspora erythraea]EQD81448.1 hypothetical protein N599_36160 [Saccharopolyspora erythraea D]QRK92720.1 hypothetical protein JQX30_16340 [Saccharopolyspora erythraea]CAM02462.1 hypothetical protein SACE_3186 [Saccharopolyspora erythraea NRRL 2338]